MCPTHNEKSAEILLDYCAGTLDRHRVAEFERHALECEDCRKAIEAQRELWQTLDQWTPAGISPDFDARLYARIEQEQAKSPWAKWWAAILHPATPSSLWKPAVSVAVAAIVLVVGLLVHGFNPAPAANAGKQVRADSVDIEQMESTLEDLELLNPQTSSASPM